MLWAWIVNAGVLLFLVRACVSIRRQHSKARRKTGELMVSSLSGLAMGAMLLGFQEIVQPQVQHMIVEEMKETSVDDENGEPMGGRAFQEQLRRIRMGEEGEHLTVRMEPESGSESG
jgi:hypothetical protein